MPCFQFSAHYSTSMLSGSADISEILPGLEVHGGASWRSQIQMSPLFGVAGFKFCKLLNIAPAQKQASLFRAPRQRE